MRIVDAQVHIWGSGTPLPPHRPTSVFSGDGGQLLRLLLPQWGDLTHGQAMRSIELFATEVMRRYAAAPTGAPVVAP